jgi:hypothetical protein
MSDNMRVRESAEGSVYVEGLTETMCADPNEALKCLEKGLKHRRVVIYLLFEIN